MHMENGEEQDQEVGREEPQAGTSQQQQQEDDEEGVRAPIPQKQVPVLIIRSPDILFVGKQCFVSVSLTAYNKKTSLHAPILATFLSF